MQQHTFLSHSQMMATIEQKKNLFTFFFKKITSTMEKNFDDENNLTLI